MHGEAVDKPAATAATGPGSSRQSGHGAFEAPMAGNHGWFWQNLNDDPVDGHGQDEPASTARLFRP